MRHRLYLSFFVLLLLLLSGCGDESEAVTRIMVSIRESAGFTVENNGQYIQPGESVEFLLNTDAGLFLAEMNYDDGMGNRVGLGSRVSMPNKERTLYARWVKWSGEGDFDWAYNENGITVPGALDSFCSYLALKGNGASYTVVYRVNGNIFCDEYGRILFCCDDFYDTSYHLLSEPARNNTAIWLRDLQAQMERDGFWRAP